LQEDSIVADHANFIPNDLANYFWIALGAVVGAGARYFLSTLIARNFSSAFPYGTLLDPRWRLLIAIGFCGSYTTFSSYAFESFALMEQGQGLLTSINIVASNALCLAAVPAGAALARGYPKTFLMAGQAAEGRKL
jgi:CrcB protein